MKNNNILRSTLLVVLLILGAGYARAWAANDTIPPSILTTDFGGPVEIHISIADLPALLNGSIVGITLDQMDTITVDMINLDAARDSLCVCTTELDTAFMEIHKRDMIINDFTVLDDFNKREIINKDWLIEQQDQYIDIVDKKLQKQRGKTGLAWFFAGLGTAGGLAAGFFLAR